MRVLVLVRILWTAGAPKKAINQCLALRALGHEPILVFIRPADRLRGYQDILSQVPAKILWDSNESALKPILDFLTGHFAPDRAGEGRLDINLILKTPERLQQLHPDLIICHDQYAGIAGYYTSRQFGIPYVVLLHERLDWTEPSVFHPAIDWLEHRTLKNAVRVIASTEKIAETARVKHKLVVSVAYQGLRLRNFRRFSEKTRTFIAVSTWDQGRRPLSYLDMISGLRDTTLTFAGNWRDEILRTSFLSKINQLALGERIVVLENLSEQALDEAYDKCKFLVRFGFGEYGESHAVFEGLEAGLPSIVSSDLGSSGLILSHGVGATISSPTSGAVSNAIASFNTSEAYGACQSRIRAMARLLTWEEHVNTILGLA